jgi:hypothetical protein
MFIFDLMWSPNATSERDIDMFLDNFTIFLIKNMLHRVMEIGELLVAKPCLNILKKF